MAAITSSAGLIFNNTKESSPTMLQSVGLKIHVGSTKFQAKGINSTSGICQYDLVFLIVVDFTA